MRITVNCIALHMTLYVFVTHALTTLNLCLLLHALSKYTMPVLQVKTTMSKVRMGKHIIQTLHRKRLETKQPVGTRQLVCEIVDVCDRIRPSNLISAFFLIHTTPYGPLHKFFSG